jgi:hypothetical protein
MSTLFAITRPLSRTRHHALVTLGGSPAVNPTTRTLLAWGLTAVDSTIMSSMLTTSIVSDIFG